MLLTQFLAGQIAIAFGLYVLSRHIPWEACVGIWLIAEGLISSVYALTRSGDAEPEPWHGNAPEVTGRD